MPAKPTLVIVDVQKAFDDPAWGPRKYPGAEGNVARQFADVVSTDEAIARMG